MLLFDAFDEMGIAAAGRSVVEQFRMLVFGLAMVLLMIWRPRGLIGHRAPTVFLHHSQAISSDRRCASRGLAVMTTSMLH